MARISEYEQSGPDTIEVAISASEFSQLGSGLQFRFTTLDQDGNDAPDVVNGGTLSFVLSTNPADWTLDPQTGEYVNVRPLPGGGFGGGVNNHNENFQGFALTTENASGDFLSVDDAYMLGQFGGALDPTLATSVGTSAFVPSGTPLVVVDQSSPSASTGGNNDATVRWDAPDIDTAVVRRDSALGDSGTAPICFAAGTLISCEDGERSVETLRPGDRVFTHAHGLQEIRWIGVCRFSGADLRADERRRPVRIGAGALGPSIPVRDLVVSRQHRVLASSSIVEDLAGVQRVLIAAHRLTRFRKVSLVCPERGVTYYHILFDHHEIVFANGLGCESLFLSKQAETVKLIGDCDLIELESIGLVPDDAQPAFPIPSARLQKEIVKQHVAVGAALAEPFATPRSERIAPLECV